jgi:hypothetical protein
VLHLDLSSATLRVVPTTKQRITITATGDLERILAVEQRLHPDLSPSGLVAMLIRRGSQTSRGVSRRELVEGLAGGVRYPSDYRKELRDEWSS